MKILFFDMEFANGQVPGSIYSIGYLMTDSRFRTVVKQTDLLINPDCEWNSYVADKILAYPMETIEASPLFPACYEKIRALFAEADIAVGFSVNNDVTALRKVCERYKLSPIPYFWFDMERVCKRANKHRGAHGLAGCVTAWCGQAPENQHRSDGDALATMMLLRAICRAKHVTPDMLTVAYPECTGSTRNPIRRAVQQPKQGGRGRRRHLGRKKTEARAGAPSPSES
jgi:DNA polymerase III epsilon subunit-like protein